MAAGAVTFSLIKLHELLQEEADLLAGVQKEVQYVTDELAFMKSYLLTRVPDQEDSYHGVEELAGQVRDIAYDMEDALDDYKLRVARDHGHEFPARLKKTFHFIRSSYARHRIATKLRNCKSRVKNTSEAYRSHFVNQGLPPKQQLMSSSTRTYAATRLGDALLVEEANLVAIEKPKKQLIDWLIQGKTERQVVSVVGMAGLGKTTVVKKAYEDPKVKAHFVFHAWITLTRSFDVEDLLKEIVQQLYQAVRMPDPQGKDNMDNANDKLRTTINDFLRERRYLIVLDDIWNVSDWRTFEAIFPDNTSGSRVLITTRETDIASACSAKSPDKVQYLDKLSEQDSWTLFCKKTFPNSSCPPHLQKVSKKILARCEGLPLAIVTIGGVLVTMNRSRLEEWEMFYRGLGNVLAPENRLELTEVLLVSYNYLPYYLRSCFMYFSIFPEGDPIERMRLVRLWIAEGFVKQRDGMTLEDVATKYINELVSRNFVQVVEATSDGQVKTCRVHHLLREIMTFKAKNEGFLATINENSSDFPKKVRRLSLHNATESIRESRIPSQLRSVLTFWKADSSSKWHMFNFSSSRLRLLNVLDLRGAPLDAFPKDVVSLQSLKYLSLRNTNVSSVPGSIRKLKNLETLDLKHALVNQLPAEISELQKLRHLLVYHFRNKESDDQIRSKSGFKTLAQIGKVLSLQKLCFLEVDNVLLTQLGKLNQLRRLGILKLQETDGETLCSVIKAQVNLLSLSVTSKNESEIIDMNFLNSGSCPKFLRRLYLTGPLRKLPDWISSLENLAKVVLKGSRLSDDPLPCLEDLPNLVHLEFNQVHEGDKMTLRSGKFQKLKFLGLNKFVNLKLIFVHQGALPCLQELIIECCQLLQKVPFGIKYLTELRALKFFDMPSDFIRRLRPDGGEDSRKLQHVREVLGTYRSNGKLNVYSKGSFEDIENRAGPSTSYEWKD